MAYADLREWISVLEREGELKRVKATVQWDGEIGAITRKMLTRGGPALLFESIAGYEEARVGRLLVSSMATVPRVALMLGLPKDTPAAELAQVVKKRFRSLVEPVVTGTGPVKENIFRGDAVDLFSLPVPTWHPLDGGRYINTMCGVVTRDPETGKLNVGVYRGMILSKDKIGVLLVTAQNWGQHYAKYQAMGKPMPVAVVYGWDPALEFTAGATLPPDVSEYAATGGLRQQPVELVRCETSDLLVPASAEIVVEGSISPDPSTYELEGPFGEFGGYYGTAARRPVIQVSCITHRNDAIFRGTLEGASVNNPSEGSATYAVIGPATLYDILEAAGIPGILEVRMGPMTVIKIRQTYYGQAKQVAAAIWGSRYTQYSHKIIMVVDEDVDVKSFQSLEQAFAQRVNPAADDIVFFPGSPGSPLDPSVPAELRDEVRFGGGRWTRILIDATKSMDLEPRADSGDRYPPSSVALDPKDEALVERRWKEYGLE